MNVIWTEAALADLKSVEIHIGRHSKQYARSMIQCAEQLAESPTVCAAIGDILAVVHGARRMPRLRPKFQRRLNWDKPKKAGDGEAEAK